MIHWPGNQINDITKFREDCYRKCHDNNPTDSGWYEKTDKCGQECKRRLKEFEYEQGKNPCELRLQAPVFWFKENYTKDGNKMSSLDLFYLIIFILLILICIFYIYKYLY